MTMFGASWGLHLIGLTPLAKLVAIRLGDGCNADGRGVTDLQDLVEWCCAPRQEILIALKFLNDKSLVTWVDEGGDRLAYELPAEARPQPRRPEAPSEALATIYVMRGRIGTKIGMTARPPAARLESIRAATLDESVTLEWSVAENIKVVRRAERRAHEKMAAHRVLGEWFDISVDRAKSAIIESIQEIKRELG